ncbi:hypothetical protein LINGRAHAP2_LOCUS17416 [Linum grandiflorum]
MSSSRVPPFVHHHQARQQQQQQHEGFALTMGRAKNPISDDENDDNNDNVDAKTKNHWQRVKWTDPMIKLLITAVSYVGEEGSDCCGGNGKKRTFGALQKKGKWKSVSKAMAERGFLVSPQQCEDKFNDLNKRYKKLNDIIGRGTSCQVVENPALLDVIDYLSEKEKGDVRKILSSKHLFYEEMCSYHNNNRLHLPHDPALQRSLQLALRSSHGNDEDEDDDEDDEDEDEGEDERKRLRKAQGQKDVTQVDMNETCLESIPKGLVQKQWIESRTLQLEEERLQIEVEKLELEKERFRWQRFSRKRDQELEKLRMENERMKLENERMALELKRKGNDL